MALLVPVASALDAAHEAGIVHRDVKPQNILIDRAPGHPVHAYLTDFGLAKNSELTSLATYSGAFVGTPAYAAPEQFIGGDVGPEADQFGLACVIFEALSGKLPFSGQNLTAAMVARMSGVPVRLTEYRPDLPSAADKVLAKALAPDPAGRYGSCEEFASALDEAFRSGAVVLPRGPAKASAPGADAADGNGEAAPRPTKGARHRPRHAARGFFSRWMTFVGLAVAVLAVPRVPVSRRHSAGLRSRTGR
jgi:serine/threonine-protein kinase